MLIVTFNLYENYLKLKTKDKTGTYYLTLKLYHLFLKNAIVIRSVTMDIEATLRECLREQYFSAGEDTSGDYGAICDEDLNQLALLIPSLAGFVDT